WADIVANADKSRWMSTESSADQSLVVVHAKFHQAIRDEMRNDAAFDSLHDRAIRHYRELIAGYSSDAYPQEWLRWKKAVLYPMFRREEYRAADEWRDAVAEAHAAGRLDLARSLVKYVTEPDFQDLNGQPVFVPDQVLYKAYVEYARIAAQLAGRLPGP